MNLLLSNSAFADAGIPMAFVVPSGERGGLGEIQSANGAMAFFTGRSMEELTGLAFAELVHRDDVAIGGRPARQTEQWQGGQLQL